MAGFQFIRTQHGNLEITYVMSNSPASQSNLENGDQIISINGKPSNQYTYDELDDIFRLEEEIIKLVIFHSGEEKEVTIQLHRLI
jgi:C-terminal processing protease CtpA/Prc